MICPNCAIDSEVSHTKVVDSRNSRMGTRRRRECLRCHRRFTTFEADIAVWNNIASASKLQYGIFERALAAAFEVIERESKPMLITDTNQERKTMAHILQSIEEKSSPEQLPPQSEDQHASDTSENSALSGCESPSEAPGSPLSVKSS